MEIFTEADTSTAVIAILTEAAEVEVYGMFNELLYVKYKDRHGWIRNDPGIQ